MALIIGVAIRGFLAYTTLSDLNILTQYDQKDYIRLASGLIENKDFGEWYKAERVPLYPVFLAACHAVSGSNLVDGSLPDRSFVIIIIVQNLLGLLTVFIMYLAGRIISSTVADLCAGFTAINSSMAMYCNQILTEALFTPWMVITWYAFVLYREKQDTSFLIGLSGLLGLGTLIRLVNLYIPLFFIPFLMFESDRPFRKRVVNMIVFSMVFVSCLLPWIYRNHLVYGHAKMTTHGAAHIGG